MLPQGLSRTLLRSGNLFNSLGLVAVSALVFWQAVERLANPLPVLTWVPVVVGLGAAAANGAIARLLWQPGRHNAAIRLAYLHNDCARGCRLARRTHLAAEDPMRIRSI